MLTFLCDRLEHTLKNLSMVILVAHTPGMRNTYFLNLVFKVTRKLRDLILYRLRIDFCVSVLDQFSVAEQRYCNLTLRILKWTPISLNEGLFLHQSFSWGFEIVLPFYQLLKISTG